MASDSLTSQSVFINEPYLKLAPYTGHYQLRRKFEDSSTGAGMLSKVVGYQRMYYSYSLIRNRLRGVYPTGGRMGMCISLENTRTARYMPYNTYSWPKAESDMPLWSPPMLLSSNFSNITMAFNAGLGNFTMLGFAMTFVVGMTDVHVANDATPPAGFSSDLTGVCVFVRNTKAPAQFVDLDKVAIAPKPSLMSAFNGHKSHAVVLENRYDLEEVELNPELVTGVSSSASSILAEVRPSGLFWPLDPDGNSDTFNTDRILPEVETWREMNLYPIGSGGHTVGNFPYDYSIIGDQDPIDTQGNSSIFKDGAVALELDNYIYWVTREGPVDYAQTVYDKEGKPKTQIDRKVLIFLFGVDVQAPADNTTSRYRTEIEQLVGSNSISPRYRLDEEEKLLQPPLLPLGGYYNNVFPLLNMKFEGAPAEKDIQGAEISEIAHQYTIKDTPLMCGNIILDDNMFTRMNTSGYVHVHMWGEAGNLLRLQHQDQIVPGMNTSLVGLMIQVASLNKMMAPQYSSDKLSLYLGGFTHSLTQNNTVPEIGVALGSHRSYHTISMLQAGATFCPEDDAAIAKAEKEKAIEEDRDPVEEAPVDINELISIIPENIYEYNGFAASPHRISMNEDGTLLIPTDIGILHYDLLNKKVLGEWLNPTLIPFITEHIKIQTTAVRCKSTLTLSEELVHVDPSDKTSPLYFEANISSLLYEGDIIYSADSDTILSVDAEEVYNNTSHMGSYGQVIYESSTIAGDLIVLLNR